uniref:Uncharacterized protein n=1 Tax=Brassica campestris TaxID=3711 RepID=M4CU52_BRACM
MAMRWSRRGKEIDEETVEADDVKELLPERLFATDRFPNKRVNTTDYLSRVRNALNNTLEMAKLIGSCFEGSSSCQHRGNHYGSRWWGSEKDGIADRLIGSDMYVAVVESETEMSGWRKRRRWRTVEERPEKTPAKRPKYHAWRRGKHMTLIVSMLSSTSMLPTSHCLLFIYLRLHFYCHLRHCGVTVIYITVTIAVVNGVVPFVVVYVTVDVFYVIITPPSSKI